jgi:hypothetical protein
MAPGGGAEQRWTPCILYWITPTTVAKVAYEFDNREDGSGQDAFLFQLATGF